MTDDSDQHPAITAIREREDVRRRVEAMDRDRIEELERALEVIGRAAGKFRGTHQCDPFWILVRDEVRRVMCHDGMEV